jgi:hypothetical protein
MLDSTLSSPILEVPISGAVWYCWSRKLDLVPVVEINNLKCNWTLHSMFSHSVNLSLCYFYRFLIFKIYCYNIFIKLSFCIYLFLFNIYYIYIFISIYIYFIYTINLLLQSFYWSLIFKMYQYPKTLKRELEKNSRNPFIHL